MGIDLRYQLDGLLRSPLQRALSDARDKAVEAVKLRAAEDKWRPTNLGNKDALTKFVMETGLPPNHMQKYVQGRRKRNHELLGAVLIFLLLSYYFLFE